MTGPTYREYLDIINDTLYFRILEIEWVLVPEYTKEGDTSTPIQYYTKATDTSKSQRFIGYRKDTISIKDTTHIKTFFNMRDKDSIIQILNQVKDDYNFIDFNMRGGMAQKLDIYTGRRQIKYHLSNQGDSITFKIYAILNKYLPEKFRILSLLNYWESFVPADLRKD